MFTKLSGLQKMKDNTSNIEKWPDHQLFDALSSKHTVAEKAFTIIYNKYSKQLYSYIVRILGDDKDAQDIFQETFLRFYKYSKQKRNIEDILKLLIKFARNLCINKIRDRKPITNIDKLDIFSEEPEYNEEEVIRSILAKALDFLDFESREVIVLHHYQNLTFNEISYVTGMTLANVKSKYYRGKEKLRKIIEPILKNY